jgi:hypothetical protein
MFYTSSLFYYFKKTRAVRGFIFSEFLLLGRLEYRQLENHF